MHPPVLPFQTTPDTLLVGLLARRRNAGLDPVQMVSIDNTCPSNFEVAGVSAEEAKKEKLEWKDVFELTEWFRPGTIKRDANFNPNKM